MSLLLDARKKSQQAQAAAGGNSGMELSLEPHPDAQNAATSAVPSADVPTSDDRARMAGQNLFNAKSGAPALAPAGINRNLLIFLGVMLLVLVVGGGYVWYAITSGPAPAVRPIKIAAAPVAKAPANNLVPEIAAAQTAAETPAKIHRAARSIKPSTQARARKSKPVLIEQLQADPIDPVLNDAYAAYRSGNFGHAQQLYGRALRLDPNNVDALLGLAVIAQRRGQDNIAAHYYAQVMALDPRNAVANAGMSALSNDDNRVSRLKILLNEQPNSSALHFALGNLYAGQARWGEAQQAYFNAYKLESGNAELAFNLAVSLDRLGQNKPAAQFYQRALQLDPDQHAAFDHANISQRIEALTH